MQGIDFLVDLGGERGVDLGSWEPVMKGMVERDNGLVLSVLGGGGNDERVES